MSASLGLDLFFLLFFKVKCFTLILSVDTKSGLFVRINEREIVKQCETM